MLILEKVPQIHRLKVLQTIDDNVCSECGSFKLREVDGKIVCLDCAIERNNGHGPSMESDFNLGTQGSPETHLAFGKNLGGTLQRNDLFQVLAQGVNGSRDVGLRARQIRILTHYVDHPTIRNMLETGSQLCEEFGVTGKDAVFFADHLGKLLRKVGTAAILQKTCGESIEARRLAITTFVFTWQLMERDKGLRQSLIFEPEFPGKRQYFNNKTQYPLRMKDWDFVFWVSETNPTAPTTKRSLRDDLQIQKMRKMGRVLCDKWFGQAKIWQCPTTNVKVNGVKFLEVFEKYLTRIGEFWVGTGLAFPIAKYVKACFAVTMRECEGDREYLYTAERLKVNYDLMNAVFNILEKTRCPSKKQIPRTSSH